MKGKPPVNIYAALTKSLDSGSYENDRMAKMNETRKNFEKLLIRLNPDAYYAHIMRASFDPAYDREMSLAMEEPTRPDNRFSIEERREHRGSENNYSPQKVYGFALPNNPLQRDEAKDAKIRGNEHYSQPYKQGYSFGYPQENEPQQNFYDTKPITLAINAAKDANKIYGSLVQGNKPLPATVIIENGKSKYVFKIRKYETTPKAYADNNAPYKANSLETRIRKGRRIALSKTIDDLFREAA